MSKRSNTTEFTQDFKEILNLSDDQISKIDLIELQFYRDYYWNNEVEDYSLVFTFIRRLFSILNENQILKLKEHKKAHEIKARKREAEQFQKSYEYQKKRLSSLNLSENQLRKIVGTKKDRLKLYKNTARSDHNSAEKEASRIKKQVDEVLIHPILNKKQLDGYLAIVEGEERSKKEWSIKHKKESFEKSYNIILTQSQAIQLLEVEYSTPTKDLNGQYYSKFEKAEMQLQELKKLLSQDQFVQYKPFHEKKILQIEKRLRISNNDQLIQLQRTKAYFEYYVKNVLPYICQACRTIEKMLNQDQKDLIKQIRKYYLTKLDQEREKFRTQHHRYNRDLAPNALENFLICNKLHRIDVNICYLDDYEPVKKLMTDDVIDVLKKEVCRIQNVLDKPLNFKIESYERTGGTYGALILRILKKKGEEHLDHIGLLLVDPEIQKNLSSVEMR